MHERAILSHIDLGHFDIGIHCCDPENVVDVVVLRLECRSISLVVNGGDNRNIKTTTCPMIFSLQIRNFTWCKYLRGIYGWNSSEASEAVQRLRPRMYQPQIYSVISIVTDILLVIEGDGVIANKRRRLSDAMAQFPAVDFGFVNCEEDVLYNKYDRPGGEPSWDVMQRGKRFLNFLRSRWCFSWQITELQTNFKGFETN